MLDALEEALAIDLAIEGAGSPDKVQFMDIARREGLKAAIAWRDARFPGQEPHQKPGQEPGQDPDQDTGRES